MEMKELEKRMQEIAQEINKLEKDAGDYLDLVIYDEEDLEEDHMRNTYASAMGSLTAAATKIRYMKRQVRETGTMKKQQNGRYKLTPDGLDITSGEVLDILIQPESGRPYWITTRIEHDGSDYYAVAMRGMKNTKLDGLRARRR